MTPDILFANIEAAAPSFGAVIKEHVADNGELLPHVLMGDLLRYIGGCLGSSGDSLPAQSELHAVLEALEAAATSGNDEVQSVIAVSFCENIEIEPFYPKLRPLLGPRLRRCIRNQMAGSKAPSR